jgi:protoporphyrinogen oxidase
MTQPSHIAILGGGPAGLAVGYYARKRGLPFTVFEARDRVGGNCITHRHRDFRYDSGAHRLHDKEPEVTAEVQALLQADLRRINVPSLIYSEGKYIDFPLSPLNLAAALGLPKFAKAAAEVLRARLSGGEPRDDFESFAVRTYGRTLAERFLLGYSEKLWGVPCRKLSPRVAGKRMKGLTLKTFVKEALLGHKAKTEHLDGAFYYPRAGIGMIPDALAAACGEAGVRRNAEITGIRHDGRRMRAVVVNGSQTVEAGFVASTLPLDRFLQMMDPRPPEEILTVAGQLRYRNVILVALFLGRPTVTRAATLYFPGPEFPFTRLYEPRNRSADMSPPGRTSLVIEMPCQADDPVWALSDAALVERVSRPLFRCGLIAEREVIDATVARMNFAYPVLEAGFEDRLGKVMEFLAPFENLALSGRSGRFEYTHVHDLMKLGRQIVDRIAG